MHKFVLLSISTAAASIIVGHYFIRNNFNLLSLMAKMKSILPSYNLSPKDEETVKNQENILIEGLAEAQTEIRNTDRNNRKELNDKISNVQSNLETKIKMVGDLIDINALVKSEHYLFSQSSRALYEENESAVEEGIAGKTDGMIIVSDNIHTFISQLPKSNLNIEKTKKHLEDLNRKFFSK